MKYDLFCGQCGQFTDHTRSGHNAALAAKRKLVTRRVDEEIVNPEWQNASCEE